MRLLELNGGDLVSTEFRDHELPAYAILSHTWHIDNAQEVTFQDVEDGKGEDKVGWRKIEFCAKKAALNGLRYFWVDTCCIDKRSSAELSHAINSMFRWYQNATRCYVCLTDVTVGSEGHAAQAAWEHAFRSSRWFTRGWTLQELVAPKVVDFYDADGELLGTKSTLGELIQDITGIPVRALEGTALNEFDVDERMSWTAKRETSVDEDAVYCLLGIFDVSMPLVYAEGRKKALKRLQEEIAKSAISDNELAERPAKRKKLELSKPEEDAASMAEERSDFLTALHYDQIEDRLSNIKAGHISTCKWFVERDDFKAWLNSNDAFGNSGFFWIKGKPGCGKSTLAKFILEHVQKDRKDEPKTTILSFFFNARGSPLEKSTVGLYRSLLVQLLEPHLKVSRVWEAVDLAKKRSNTRVSTSVETLRQLLSRTIKALDQHEIILIIDALDECDEVEIRAMASFMSELSMTATADRRALRVLFSSRHYPRITVERHVELVLDRQHGHAEDIVRYIASELKIGRSKTADSVKHQVATRASGVFMWVVLVVQILNTAFEDGRIHTLQKKLGEIPDGLDKLFISILARDERNMNEMKFCLHWLLHANRQLSREELYYAIMSGTDPTALGPWNPGANLADNMDRFILSCSKGLAEITRSKRGSVRIHAVQFIHESVREFLLKKDRIDQVWADFSRDNMGKIQDRLKACCWTYIITDTDQDLPGDEETQRKAALTRFPFLEYAVDNVLLHADLAHAEDVSQDSFLQNWNASKWLRWRIQLERYKNRKISPDSDIVYILAESGCAELLKPVLTHRPLSGLGNARAHESWKRSDNKHEHRDPILVAFANQDAKTFEVLVAASLQTDADSTYPYNFNHVATFISRNERHPWIHRLLSTYSKSVEKYYKNHREKNVAPMLLGAVHTSQTQVIRFLLAHGADTDVATKATRIMPAMYEKFPFSPWTPLAVAAAMGSAEMVNLLLDHGAKINSGQEQDSNAMYQAYAQGHDDVVKLLLDRGADLAFPSLQQPNDASLQNSRESIARMLLCRGSLSEQSERDNGLSLAVHHGLWEFVPGLLHRGANPNRDGPNDPALLLATKQGLLDMVQALLDHGADPDAVDSRAPSGYPLLEAALQSRLDIAQALISRGVNPNQIYRPPFSYRFSRGASRFVSALWPAAERGHYAMTKLLLDQGAVVDLGADPPFSPLCAAAAFGHADVAKLLIEHFKGNIETAARNAVCYAALNVKTPMVKLLLSQCSSIDTIVPHLGNALQAALLHAANPDNIFEPLLSPSKEILQDSSRYFAIITASYTHLLADQPHLARDPGHLEWREPLRLVLGHKRPPFAARLEILRLLLTKQPDVNLQGGPCGCALHAAIVLGCEDAVSLLIDAGADPWLRCEPFGDALEAARIVGGQSMIELVTSRMNALPNT